jgi:hypothetical protein
MPLLSAAVAAGGLVFAPLLGNSTLTGLSAPQRLEISYEGIVPVPILGRLKAAEATMTADITSTGYTIRTKATAAGVVDWFVDYNLDISSAGAVGPAGLKPVRYVSANLDGKKNRRVVVDFTPADVTTTATPRFGDLGNPPATTAQKLEAMDPPSAIINQAFQTTPANPCGGPIRAFDGKQRFDLQMTFGKRITYESPAYTGPATVCEVKYVEIAGFKDKSDKQKAKDKGDIQWTSIVLAELEGGAVKPILKIEARSKSRGKMTVQATSLSYGPAPVNAAARQGS